MTRQRWMAVPALLALAGCGSSATDSVSSTTFTTVSSAQVAQIVARPAATMARGLVAITRCTRDLDGCSSADQRASQQYVLLAGELAGDLSSLRARRAAPSSLDALAERTGAAASAVPTASLLCGPGSSTWPQGRDDCAARFRAAADAAGALTSVLREWDDVRG